MQGIELLQIAAIFYGLFFERSFWISLILQNGFTQNKNGVLFARLSELGLSGGDVF